MWLTEISSSARLQGPAAVPKFGSWDAENIGYTVFFEKVRDNKGPPAPPKAAPGGYDFDPYENLSRKVPSHGGHASNNGHAPAAAHRRHGAYDDCDPYENLSSRNGHHHRRTGSNGSSAASESSNRASMFSPPRPYQPRYTKTNNNNHRHQEQHQHQHQQYGNGHGGCHPQQGAPSPSPPPPLRRPKPSAVPRFGVWDEQNAAHGFTVQFEKVKRHREEAKAAAAPTRRDTSPDDRYAPAPAQRKGRKRKANNSFLSKVYRCMFPVVRQ
jgi:hypothetical protein